MVFGVAVHASPPNFIFFITDDISHDDLSVYGNEFVQTPNLEKMAGQGMVFDNAYNVISSCSPSRCAIITGRYPHNTGAPELHTELPEEQLTFVEVLRDAGYYTLLSGKNHMNKKIDSLGFAKATDSGPSGSEKWTQHLRDRPKDQSFFFWFASHDAHHDFRINDKAPVYDPAAIQVPPMLFDGPETRKDLAGYYHEVSRSDYYLGEIMKELEKQGIADNTYVIYCADNGRPFPRCKSYMYESGIQTPLIITGPKVGKGRTEALASSIDYSATILELAGIDKPEFVQGVSLVPVLKNPKATVRDVAFSERNWHVFSLHERAVGRLALYLERLAGGV
jgi:arylsulfatase